MARKEALKDLIRAQSEYSSDGIEDLVAPEADVYLAAMQKIADQQEHITQQAAALEEAEEEVQRLREAQMRHAESTHTADAQTAVLQERLEKQEKQVDPPPPKGPAQRTAPAMAAD